MAVFIILIVLFFLLPDLYVSLALMRGAAWWAHLLLWLPALAALGLFASARFGGFGATKMMAVTGILLCVTLPQIALVVCSLLGKLAGVAWPHTTGIANGIGLVLGGLIALVALYGLLVGWKTLSVKQVELQFADLPKEFDGYKIVQLSDLHVGTHGNHTAFLEKVVHRTNAENPDLVVFTGDLVNLSANETEPFEKVLSQLRATDGVLSVLGNHDYCFYGMKERPSDLRQESRKVVEAERRMGWDVLLNEHRIIRRNEAQIAIAGVENTGKPPFPEIGDLKKAIAGIPEGIFTILLSHDPSHWRMEILPETDIPITLSGHTHAAQVKLGRWSPAKWMYPEWGGLYTEDSQRLFVSEGLGGSVPFRLGTRPEIVVITLKNSKTH